MSYEDVVQRSELLEAIRIADHFTAQQKFNKFQHVFFQDEWTDSVTGLDLSRKNYVKHVEFLNATARYRQLCLRSGNRIGKTESVTFGCTAWLTGLYPDWWEGKRFDKPVKIWAIADTTQKANTILQEKFLGKYGNFGTGMIPKFAIKNTLSKPGISGTVAKVIVKHYDKFGNYDGDSEVSFMSAEQGVDAFTGEEIDVVWFDEEPKTKDAMAIYEECRMRTMTTEGLVIITYTPIHGITQWVLNFLGNLPYNKLYTGPLVDKEGKETRKFLSCLTWDDAPHLTQEMKDAILEGLLPHQIQYKMLGIPTVGEGAIYPFVEAEHVVKLFPIPDHWPRAYGVDFGVNPFTAVFMAQDPSTGIKYVYGEYQVRFKSRSEQIAFLLNAGGDWMTGVADHSGGGYSGEGRALTAQEYIDGGLDLRRGVKGIDASIGRLHNEFSCGMIKIMSHCEMLIRTIAIYKYGEDGKPDKNQDDHGCDALRYIDYDFEQVAISRLDMLSAKDSRDMAATWGQRPGGNKVTGY